MSDTVTTLRFTLPWPPSVNTYWRHIVLGGKFKKARAQVLLSEQGRAYRVTVAQSVQRQHVPKGAVHGKLSVTILASPPDRRTRDLDNLLKGTLDSLAAAGVFGDDGDIDELIVRRWPIKAGGELAVEVRELGEFNEQHAFDLPQPMAARPF